MADGKVIIETDLDTKGVESGLSSLEGKVKAGAAIAGASLVAGLGAAVKTGIDFESAFAGVKKTVNATDTEIGKLRSGILKMSTEMPTSANEIAGVAEAAGQLGIKTNNILGFSKTMVQLGDSTNMSADSAATSLARLANITGMPQKNFDRLGSTVVALGNNLATTEQEIVDTSMRIAGAGSQVGMSEAQIMSFSGALSSVGIGAEAGGTAFSTLLSKMNLATTKGGDSLNSFAKVAGMSSAEFKKAFKEDASGAVVEFIKGLDTVNKSGGSAIKTLDDMGLSDVRMRDTLLRAAGASDTFTNALKIGNDAWNKNTALSNEAQQRYQTMESKIKKLGNQFKKVGIHIYDALDGPIGSAVSSATKHLSKLNKAIDKDGIESIIPKEAINTVKNFGSVVSSVAGGGLKILGTTAKFVGDNLSTVLPVATAFLTVLKGYKVVASVATAIRTAQAGLTSFGAAQIACTAMGVKCTATLTVGQAAFGLFTGQVTLATAATTAFNAACTLLGGPVGVAVLAIGALVAGLVAYDMTQDKSLSATEKATNAFEKEVEKQKELTKEINSNKKARQDAVETTENEGIQAGKLADRLDSLMAVEKKSAGQKAQIKSIVEQLNGIYPDLNLKYDEEKDKLNQSTEAIRNNIAAQKELAMAKAYASQMESTAKDIVKQEKQNEVYAKKAASLQDDINKKQEQVNKLEKAAAGKSTYSTEYKKYQTANAELLTLTATQEGYNTKLEEGKKKVANLNKEMDGWGNKQIGATNFAQFQKDLDNLAKEAGIKAKNVPASIGQGIKDGIYANPVTGADLKQLIKLDDLMSSDELAKMQQQGMKIPEYLTQGISDGSITFKNAVKQLQNGMDWSGMIEKAKQKGIEVPDSVAQGIQSG
ncbi:MAG: phage tail tape measure protein, partial [Lachnospiraceae bacterium]|nr:phage tail tape measure protein [Lachnospiraceae bacterium]